jgi:hypothetical protein
MFISFSSEHWWSRVRILAKLPPWTTAKSKATPNCHAPTHFIQTFYSELVFILDFHVLFHVIR